jgi:hypothetical protein
VIRAEHALVRLVGLWVKQVVVHFLTVEGERPHSDAVADVLFFLAVGGWLHSFCACEALSLLRVTLRILWGISGRGRVLL